MVLPATPCFLSMENIFNGIYIKRLSLLNYVDKSLFSPSE